MIRRKEPKALFSILCLSVLGLSALFGGSLSGCGDSEGSAGPATSSSTSAPLEAGSSAQPTAPAKRAVRKSSGNEGGTATTAPPAAERQVEQLKAQFSQPEPTGAEDSASAIAAGRSACRGKTPLQVKEEFYAKSDLDPAQRKLVAELPTYEADAKSDPSFVAAQIAATVYAGTLPGRSANDGLRGCVYELARELEVKLASGG